MRVRLLGEDLDRLPRHRRARRSRRRVLPAPPRADVLRPQRRVRAALRLPRLEVRRERRAASTCRRNRRDSLVQNEGHDQGLPDVGRRRRRLDLHGAARARSRAAGLRVRARARRRIASSRRRSKSATGCRRSRAASTPSHATFVHNNDIGDRNWLRNRDARPRLEVERTDYGYTYAAIRDARRRRQYVRVYHYVMPAQQMRGRVTARERQAATSVPTIDGHIWVPIDDEHTLGLQLDVLVRPERCRSRRSTRRARDASTAAARTI